MKRTILTTLAALCSASAMAAPAFAKDSPAPELSNPNHAFVRGAAPESNVSPGDNGFACFNAYLASDPRRPVFSVGRIFDQTGKFSNEASQGGFEVTQGLANEVYTALGKLGPNFAVVERTDTEIPNFELSVWKQHLLGDPQEPGSVDPKTGAVVGKGLRQYHGGQVLATDYYITGAITEVNYNIDSHGIEGSVNNIGAGRRVYSMSVAMDLRVVDARTLRVVRSVSERKIYRGYEVKTGVFNFLGIYLIDINAGKKAQEPIELGVRATMESALLKLVGAVYDTDYGDKCSSYAAGTYGNVHLDAMTGPAEVKVAAGTSTAK